MPKGCMLAAQVGYTHPAAELQRLTISQSSSSIQISFSPLVG